MFALNVNPQSYSVLLVPGHGGIDGQGTPGSRDTNFHSKNFFTLLKIFLA